MSSFFSCGSVRTYSPILNDTFSHSAGIAEELSYGINDLSHDLEEQAQSLGHQINTGCSTVSTTCSATVENAKSILSETRTKIDETLEEAYFQMDAVPESISNLKQSVYSSGISFFAKVILGITLDQNKEQSSPHFPQPI